MSRNIAFVTHSQYPVEPRARRMAEALVKHGYVVDVFCLKHTGEAEREVIGGVSVHRLPISRQQGRSGRSYVWEYLRFFLAVGWQLLRQLPRKRYALVQVYNPPDILALSTLPLRLLSGTRVVLDVRDMAPELFQSRFGLSDGHVVTRMLRAHERWSCLYADAVTVCTIHQRNVMVQRGIPVSKQTVIMNCPDEAIFQAEAGLCDRPSARSPEVFSLIYHGGILKRYGLDVLVQAIPMLAREIPGLRVDIYGVGDFLPHVQQLALSLGVGSIIYFHGYRPLEEMPALICAADVGVVPVRRDIFTDTILPTKLMEYARLGVPAVTTRTATISEYFTDDMVAYFESGHAEELAQRVLGIYHHPEQAQAMAAQAQRFSEAHNWPSESAAYAALVDRLLAKS